LLEDVPAFASGNIASGVDNLSADLQEDVSAFASGNIASEVENLPAGLQEGVAASGNIASEVENLPADLQEDEAWSTCPICSSSFVCAKCSETKEKSDAIAAELQTRRDDIILIKNMYAQLQEREIAREKVREREREEERLRKEEELERERLRKEEEVERERLRKEEEVERERLRKEEEVERERLRKVEREKDQKEFDQILALKMWEADDLQKKFLALQSHNAKISSARKVIG